MRCCFSLTVFNVFSLLCFQKCDYNVSALDFFGDSSGGTLSFSNLQIYAFYKIWEVFVIIIFLSLFQPYCLFWNLTDRNTKSLFIHLESLVGFFQIFFYVLFRLIFMFTDSSLCCILLLCLSIGFGSC